MFIRLPLIQRWLSNDCYSKQHALDADPKVIQQINFTTNLDREDGAKIFFILEKVKKYIYLGLFTRNCKNIVNVLFNKLSLSNMKWLNTQYNSLNVKLSDSQLNKLKSTTNNYTEVVLRLSSNVIDNSNDETNFPHK